MSYKKADIPTGEAAVSTFAHSSESLKAYRAAAAELEDLAVAFAVYWVATGQPLFGWRDEATHWNYLVRAAGGALCFDGDGLSVFDMDGADRIRGVGVLGFFSKFLAPARRTTLLTGMARRFVLFMVCRYVKPSRLLALVYLVYLHRGITP